MSSTPVLGCIADDVTGATDLASLLNRKGANTIQYFGIPSRPLQGNADAIVIALKTRLIDPADAVRQSTAAFERLKEWGIRNFYFKYCSTFDSTADGNIGPVADALAGCSGSAQALFVPSFPQNQRTVYGGHLFVGSDLLHESGMQNHPTNPMTDSNLQRVLAQQSSRPVGLLDLQAVRAGVGDARLETLRGEGVEFIIADAIEDDDLRRIAELKLDHCLPTGGSAFGAALYHRLACQRNASMTTEPATRHLQARHDRPIAIFSGSCSGATQAQVEAYARQGSVFRIDLPAAARGANLAADAISWFQQRRNEPSVLFSTTTGPAEVKKIQAELGPARAAQQTEHLFRNIARSVVDDGVDSMIIAGGETSGAIVDELQIQAVRIGAEIAPGVPWTTTVSEPRLNLALKSGNFGGPDFFHDALELLK